MINKDNLEAENFITPKNILTQIWFSPKKVFTFIADYKYNKYVTLLLILSGIAKALDKALSKNIGDHFPLWGVIIFVLLIGISFGPLLNFLIALAINWAGKWLKGCADTKSILRIIAYAMIPSVCSIFLIILQIPFFGNLIFQTNFYYLLIDSPFYQIYYLFIILDIILIIWSTVLLVIGLSVIQKFSILKSILNLIIAGALLVIVALALFLIIDLFQSFPNQSLTHFLF